MDIFQTLLDIKEPNGGATIATMTEDNPQESATVEVPQEGPPAMDTLAVPTINEAGGEESAGEDSENDG